MNLLLQKAIDGTRLTPAEALDILKNVPWTEVVEAGDAIRRRMNPGNRVGYTAFRIVNYTNVCEVTCSFCSFCRPVHSPEAYVLSLDEIRQKTLEAKAKGADQIFLQGGVNREIFANALHNGPEERIPYLSQEPAWYRFRQAVYLFDGKAWQQAAAHPFCALAGPGVAAYKEGLLIAGGECKPGVRSPRIFCIKW